MFLPRLHDWPLRRRLALLIAVSAGMTAAVCMATVLVAGVWIAGKRAHELTAGLTGMVADALSRPVAQADLGGVVATLSMLRARPQIHGAWVQDSAGRFLGQYGALPMPATDASGGLAHGYLISVAPVRHDGSTVGKVLVRADLGELHGLLAFTLGSIGAGSLLAIALSVLLARRIARAISRPVGQLADTAEAIARSQDYSQRLPQTGGDEIGKAMAAFNHMLAELQRREEALVELRVADRTRELQSEKERAEEASRAKTIFLSHMSHELRTPLNAVIGAAQLLDERGRPDETQAHLVAAIRDSGTRLLGLIENILDLTRIESGALELVVEEFNLVECLESAVATAAVSARLKALGCACIIDPGLEAWRIGDTLRLRQVLLNLLGNAIKFTHRGEVVLSAAPGSSIEEVHLQVLDTGIGIDPQALEHIFEPFRQADSSTTRRFGGSGLGLSITRQLVKAMGGRIGVSSTIGGGTCFDVWLPLAVGKRAGLGTPALTLPVLYHEPHEASARAVQATLLRMGCQPLRLESPEQLRRWCAEHGAAAAQAWVLLAVDEEQARPMLDAARELFHERHIIGMTCADSRGANATRSMPGLPRHIIKPVLRASLASCFGVRLEAGEAEALMQVPNDWHALSAVGSVRVLVVEDDPLNQMIVSVMLGNAGYETLNAHNGREALQLLAKREIDLVLMDWQMPDMDGLEVTRRLRRGEAGAAVAAIPVIAFTANAFTEDRAACLSAGMNDYLAKPVQAAHLEAVIARWSPAARRHLGGTRQVPAASLMQA